MHTPSATTINCISSIWIFAKCTNTWAAFSFCGRIKNEHFTRRLILICSAVCVCVGFLQQTVFTALHSSGQQRAENRNLSNTQYKASDVKQLQVLPRTLSCWHTLHQRPLEAHFMVAIPKSSFIRFRIVDGTLFEFVHILLHSAGGRQGVPQDINAETRRNRIRRQLTMRIIIIALLQFSLEVKKFSIVYRRLCECVVAQGYGRTACVVDTVFMTFFAQISFTLSAQLVLVFYFCGENPNVTRNVLVHWTAKGLKLLCNDEETQNRIKNFHSIDICQKMKLYANLLRKLCIISMPRKHLPDLFAEWKKFLFSISFIEYQKWNITF